MILVIAEKPSVAQTIAAVLGAKKKKDGFLTGSGYIVSWCVGHLVGLAEAAAYGEQYKKWSYDSLPILPQEWKYTVASDKEKQFKTLKELMNRADVSEVVNACDAGREGELIFRFCCLATFLVSLDSFRKVNKGNGFSCLYLCFQFCDGRGVVYLPVNHVVVLLCGLLGSFQIVLWLNGNSKSPSAVPQDVYKRQAIFSTRRTEAAWKKSNRLTLPPLW